MVLHYPNSTEHIKQYDIVRVKTGIDKGNLAIINFVDRPKKELHCSIINTGINHIFKITSVEFCYHNTRAAAKQWYNQMNNSAKEFIDKYSSINYIKHNWFTDYYMINNITARTIYNAIHDYTKLSSDYKLNWLIKVKDQIDLILTYNDFKFCDTVLSRDDKSYDKEVFVKLFNLLKLD